jgi:hypothetical protein
MVLCGIAELLDDIFGGWSLRIGWRKMELSMGRYLYLSPYIFAFFQISLS